MRFRIDRMEVTDPSGRLVWYRGAAPEFYAEVDGDDAKEALTVVVERDGGKDIGVTAVFSGGDAIMLAVEQESLYALRAAPLPAAGEPSPHEASAPDPRAR